MQFMLKYIQIFLYIFIPPYVLFAQIAVCTTTSLIADLVKEVGKDKVIVSNLMGPGVDPHLYKASALDLRKISQAKIVFYNGLHLEGRMIDILENLASTKKNTFAVTATIPRENLIFIENENNSDPHVWMDPKLWAMCAQVVAAKLMEIDPTNAAFYSKNAQALADRFAHVIDWSAKLVEGLPIERRILITSHDAYNYFGKAYNFRVLGVQGISTVSEAGLADVVSMVDFIKKNKVKAIFVETSVSHASINRIAQDSNADIGGELFSDSLGALGDMRPVQSETCDVGTYEGMFKYNIYTIVSALK